MAEEKELVVLERNNGWYGGYVMRDSEYDLVFNTECRSLFDTLKEYTENGYRVKCLDKFQAKAFMANRTTLQQIMEQDGRAVIWRYEVSSPFSFGKSRRAIKTEVLLHDYDVCTLHQGYPAVVIGRGPAKGVYELTSGGLVGDTVEQVNNDIDACGDMGVMDMQVKEAALVRDKEAVLVSKETFGILETEV